MYPCNCLVDFQRRLNLKIRKNLSYLGWGERGLYRQLRYSLLPSTVDLEKIRSLLRKESSGGSEGIVFDPIPCLDLAKKLAQTCVMGCLNQFDKTRPHTELRGGARPHV